MICPRCGREQSDSDDYCRFCGTKITGQGTIKVRKIIKKAPTKVRELRIEERVEDREQTEKRIRELEMHIDDKQHIQELESRIRQLEKDDSVRYNVHPQTPPTSNRHEVKHTTTVGTGVKIGFGLVVGKILAVLLVIIIILTISCLVLQSFISTNIPKIPGFEIHASVISLCIGVIYIKHMKKMN